MIPKGGIMNRGAQQEQSAIPSAAPNAAPTSAQVKAPASVKQDFSNIFEEDARLKQETMSRIQDAAKKSLPKEDMVSNLNNALSGKDRESEKIEKELGEMEKFTEQDISLAEQLLFNGFAQKDFKLTEKTLVSVTSMTAVEVDLVNEMMYEFGKKYETQDGRFDVSQKTIDHMNNLYLLAVSFRGFNGKDISDVRTRSLDLLKNAFKQLNNFEIEGDLEKIKKLREDIKSAVRARALEIKRLPTPVIDSVSQKRVEFDRTMYDIINRGDVIPKS